MEFGTREFAEVEAKSFVYRKWADKIKEELVVDFIESLMEDAECAAEEEEDEPENVYQNWRDNYKVNPIALDWAMEDFLERLER